MLLTDFSKCFYDKILLLVKRANYSSILLIGYIDIECIDLLGVYYLKM